MRKYMIGPWLSCLLATACVSADRLPMDRSMEAEVTEAPAAAVSIEANELPAAAPQRAALAALAVNPWAEPAREVLKKACGRCHRSDEPTGLPAALAIFNLVESPWYGRLRAEQFDRLLGRVQRNKQLTASDKTVIENFARCERQASCQ